MRLSDHSNKIRLLEKLILETIEPQLNSYTRLIDMILTAGGELRESSLSVVSKTFNDNKLIQIKSIIYQITKIDEENGKISAAKKEKENVKKENEMKIKELGADAAGNKAVISKLKRQNLQIDKELLEMKKQADKNTEERNILDGRAREARASFFSTTTQNNIFKAAFSRMSECAKELGFPGAWNNFSGVSPALNIDLKNLSGSTAPPAAAKGVEAKIDKQDAGVPAERGDFWGELLNIESNLGSEALISFLGAVVKWVKTGMGENPISGIDDKEASLVESFKKKVVDGLSVQLRTIDGLSEKYGLEDEIGAVINNGSLVHFQKFSSFDDVSTKENIKMFAQEANLSGLSERAVFVLFLLDEFAEKNEKNIKSISDEALKFFTKDDLKQILEDAKKINLTTVDLNQINSASEVLKGDKAAAKRIDRAAKKNNMKVGDLIRLILVTETTATAGENLETIDTEIPEQPTGDVQDVTGDETEELQVSDIAQEEDLGKGAVSGGVEIEDFQNIPWENVVRSVVGGKFSREDLSSFVKAAYNLVDESGERLVDTPENAFLAVHSFIRSAAKEMGADLDVVSDTLASLWKEFQNEPTIETHPEEVKTVEQMTAPEEEKIVPSVRERIGQEKKMAEEFRRMSWNDASKISSKNKMSADEMASQIDGMIQKLKSGKTISVLKDIVGAKNEKV